MKLLAGGKVDAVKLFPQSGYDDSIKLSFSDKEENFVTAVAQLNEEAQWVLLLRRMYDWALLKDAIKDGDSVSAGKVKVYEQHRRDLRGLKSFIRKYMPKKYGEIFRRVESNNYVSYSYNVKSVKGDISKIKKATAVDFCDYLRKQVKDIKVEAVDQSFYEDMLARLEAHTFMPKQVNGENRVIPYQLYYHELVCLLNKAESYLPFLQAKDKDGGSNRDKLLSIFTFRIPYFVGPLNEKSAFSWIKRRGEGKIYPWNFAKQVDLDKSEEAFIRRMTNKCTYMPGEDVLPLNSMLYQRYMVLNEINPLKVNGRPIDVTAKQMVYELFVQKRRVTSKAIAKCLHMQKEDILSGVDRNLNASLKSYHDFRSLLERGVLTTNDVERIIERLTYSEDKRRMYNYLAQEFPQLEEADRKYVAKLKYDDFGRLSKKFLLGFKGVNKKTRENATIMDFLWETNDNLMQLLAEDSYTFYTELEAIRKEYYASGEGHLSEMLDDMRIANSVRRSIYRTLDIVKDVCKAQGNPPKKIFLEMARGGGDKGVRTVSRREQIQKLYKEIDKEYANDVKVLSAKLASVSDNRLQSEVLYLYFLQLGRSMYSGQPINIENLKDTTLYNVDHIYPRCFVKDDSLDNKVLVTSNENGAKGDSFPIKDEIRKKMAGLWKKYLQCGLISEKKYNRLMRSTAFSDDERMGFIQWQLVETRQSTKALAEIFKRWYPDTELIYVKAGLVSDFRHEFNMLKCRSINDLHHAKDAYLNIVVGNVYHSKFNRQWFKPSDTYSLKTSTLFGHDVKAGSQIVWHGSEDIGRVRQVMQKNNIHYTRYAFERHGGLFDQRPVKKGSGLVPRKAGLEMNKYGGYNKTTASYYLLARYVLAGKKPQADVMFVPVTLIAEGQIKTQQLEVKDYLQQGIAEIIGKDVSLVTEITLPLGMRHIKINTVLDVGGFISCIAGKDSEGKNVLLKSLMSLIFAPEMEMYVKKLESFERKRTKNKKLEVNEQYDGINNETNEKLYQLFMEKVSNPPYNKISTFASLYEVLDDCQEKFASLSLAEQVSALLVLLSVFQTGRSSACDLSIIGGNKSTALYRLSSKLSNWKKNVNDVCLLDVSPSGLYVSKSPNLLEFL
ncbi:MAG: type II CRISPR RNA-guided endonuclease Cas9 [Selenomonas sp.]|nr:type II CRISPR RNA-guided endonuclease Cas9 [Selenomonas sp.]